MTDSSSAAAALLSPARWVVRTGLDEDSAADLCEPLLELVHDEEQAHSRSKHDQVGNLAAIHRGSIAQQQERLLSTLEYQPSEDEQQEPLVLFSLWDYLCLVIILPALLVVQFRMALRISRTTTTGTGTGTGTDTGSLHWLVVDKALPLWIVIALYVISALLYKICLQDLYRLRQRIQIGNQTNDSTEPEPTWGTLLWTSCLRQLVLLLPEVLMDIVLGVVWYVSAEAAAVVLVWATILLSGLVILGSAYTLWHHHRSGTAAASGRNTNGIDLEMDASQRDGVLRIPLTE
jgi:hypothetical protein